VIFCKKHYRVINYYHPSLFGHELIFRHRSFTLFILLNVSDNFCIHIGSPVAAASSCHMLYARFPICCPSSAPRLHPLLFLLSFPAFGAFPGVVESHPFLSIDAATTAVGLRSYFYSRPIYRWPQKSKPHCQIIKKLC